MYSPAVLQTGVVESPTPLQASLSSGFFSGCAIHALVRPGVPHTLALSSQRSRPVPRLVVLDILALLSWRCRACRLCFLLYGRYRGALVHSGLPQIQADLSGFFLWWRSPCARAAGGSLHTGAILTALSVGGVSGSALYSSALC